MNGADFTCDINDNAEYLAEHLMDLALQERAFAMHEPETIVRERERQQRGVGFNFGEDCADAEIEQSCLRLVKAYWSLPLKSREAVLTFTEALSRLEV